MLTGRGLGTNIAISGLTAAGKTTHGRLLAEELGYGYVSATDIMLDLVGVPAPSRGSVWLDRMSEIEAQRTGDGVDMELDRRLVELSLSRQATVFDAWALPFRTPAVLVRMWLESDLPSRVRKCKVSALPRNLPLSTCDAHVREKDESTRERFARLFDFDLFNIDYEAFDVVMDNSSLIPDPTLSCAHRGVRTFAPYVSDAVRRALGLAPAQAGYEKRSSDGSWPEFVLKAPLA